VHKIRGEEAEIAFILRLASQGNPETSRAHIYQFSAFSFNVLAKRLQALDGTDVSLKSPDLVPLNLYAVERGEECGENHQGVADYDD